MPTDEEKVPMVIKKLSAAERAERATQLADAVEAQLLHKEKAKEQRAKLLRKQRELDADVDKLHKAVLNGTEEIPAQESLDLGDKASKKKARVKLVDENPTGDDVDPDLKN